MLLHLDRSYSTDYFPSGSFLMGLFLHIIFYTTCDCIAHTFLGWYFQGSELGQQSFLKKNIKGAGEMVQCLGALTALAEDLVPEPTWWLTNIPVTPGYAMPSSGILGHLHTQCIYTHWNPHIYIKQIFQILFKLACITSVLVLGLGGT